MKKITFLLLLIFEATHAFCNATIEGKITDKTIKEPLLFVPIGLYQNDILIVISESDFDGNYFFVNVSEGNYIIKTEYLGYKHYEVDVSIKAYRDLKVNIEMEQESILLECVTVCAIKGEFMRRCFFDCCGRQVTNCFTNVEQTNEVVSPNLTSSLTNIKFNIYPNPTANKIWIQTNEVVEAVFLYDVKGALLYKSSLGFSPIEIDLSTLNVGLYILEIKHQGKFYVEKIVKIH